MSKICPITGSDGCLEFECLFYQSEYTKEPACIYVAGMAHLNEIASNLRILVKSSEQHRETSAQHIKSHALGGPTPELLRLVGIAEREE